MTLLERIKGDQLAARKLKLTATAALLTTVIGEAEMIGKNDGNRATTDAEVTTTIGKFISNMDDTLRLIGDSNPAKTLEVLGEKVCLMSYMPKKLTDLELTTLVRDIYHKIKQEKEKLSVGDIMAVLKKDYANQYDGKTASALVKAELFDNSTGNAVNVTGFTG